MAEIKTLRIKYIYLDVVGFTHNRTVETQVKIVATLNDIVRKCLTDLFPEIDVICIPIGDGICICLLGSKEVYDDYIIIAEEIIRRISSIYNPSVKLSYRFEVRIGINENVDNIITDINDNRNVCGSGVNDSQRIMNFGDSNHILVGRSVADSLMPREKYFEAFRRYTGKTKHNTNIEFYQYIGGNVAGLNREPPPFFAPPPEKRLTRYAAYYIAHVITNMHFIEIQLDDDRPYHIYPLGVLMAYLAEDSVGRAVSSRFNPYNNHIPDTPNNTIQEQFELFNNSPYWSNVDLYDLKVKDAIETPYPYCFEEYALSITERGKKKLQSEWSDIYEEFGLS